MRKFDTKLLILLFLTCLGCMSLKVSHEKPTPAQVFSPAEISAEYELSKYFGPIGVSAIMGNIKREDPSFDYRKKQEGGGGGYGLFQLDGVKKTKYFEYLNKEGKTDSLKSQIQFMVATLIGNYKSIPGEGIAKKVMDGLLSGNLRTATIVFMREWERPGVEALEERCSNAARYYDIFYGK